MKKIDWDKRYRENGHTGLDWGFAYLFDQKVKKKVLRSIISNYFGSALDYGCGVGEFLPILAERFDKVVGEDSCKSLVIDKQYTGKCKIFDYIQLMAVLSSNTYEQSLKLLKGLVKRLSSSGVMFVWDAVAVEGHECDPEQANRSREEWAKLFDESGLDVEKLVGFYNPYLVGQCASWDKYKGFCQTLGFNRLKALSDAIKLCDGVADRVISSGNDFILPIEKSNIYIWVLRRKHEKLN